MRFPSILFLLSFLPASALSAQTQADAAAHPLNPVIQRQTDTENRDAIRIIEAAKDRMAAGQGRLHNSCPAQVTIDRRPQGALVYTSTNTSERHAQRLKIAVGDAESFDDASQTTTTQKTIVAADVTVHGYSAVTRIIPASYGASRNETTESFHLVAGNTPGRIDTNVWTAKISLVNRVELTQIEYADGSIWQPSANSTCFASPSPFLLIGAAR
ncbi:MAG TPA: hypothetical protein VGU46_07050 [Acidobacteriaceae bacterium]|nr:hypothetical protein [Acidobacteriaceae bacterium]